MILHLPASPGELIDRITILELKARHFADAAKRATVARQLAALEEIWRREVTVSPTMQDRIAELRAANAALWDIEEELRALEKAQDFGPRFVSLARAVYQTNDRRAAAKRAIDAELDAPMIEEKSYVTGAGRGDGGR